MYVMRITEDTAEFIGKHFNNGVAPKVSDGMTFFLIKDDDSSNVITLDHLVMNFDVSAVRQSTLFKVD